MNDFKIPILKAGGIDPGAGKAWIFVHEKIMGSHFRYKHPDGRKTTVPMHKGKDISRGLLRKILRDIDISVEELRKLL